MPQLHEDPDVLDDVLPTVLRGADGSVEYPGQVPPAVDFPVNSPKATSQAPLKMKSPALNEQASTLPPIQEQRRVSAEGPRPKLDRQWMTERPKPATRASAVPHFRRQGTNISALNEALWNERRQQDDTSSSSSSSSSEDEEERSKMQEKKRGPLSGKARKGGASSGDIPGHGGKRYSRFAVGNENFRTRGRVDKKDGRLNISVNETGNKGYLAKALGASFLQHISLMDGDPVKGTETEPISPQLSRGERLRFSRNSSDSSTDLKIPRPNLNIVVMVIGSRGDIQPFLRLGKILKEEHGHRVRIATHPAFRDFVQNDSGLDFFSVGGDPAELMAFMVKNPGMIPKLETVRAGEIGRRRDQMYEMFEGFWRACINATDDEHDIHNLRMMGDKQPFIADAIIANPPCFAHVHCAERLGIPLHLMFTFPYTPTQAFPHPLANIKKTNVDPGYTNFMSYPLVEMMTWQGLGDLVNKFRVKTLGLEPVSTLWAPGQLYRLKVPYTYLWSPGLVPKPEDWGPEIDIAGFVFLDLASTFKPPEGLVKFLEAGEPPVYIGFGSIVVDDPDRFTKMIFEAVELAGVRALVSKGWGGLGGEDDTPDNIYMLENTPHDWLFPKVKAVVHHGGAGTTAIGLKCGKPTMIVPFFGDQQFWGNMIGRAGAGALPVPYKDLTTEKLADGIRQLLTEETRLAAEEIAEDIEEEGDGAQNAVRSFHRSLQLHGEYSLRCCILEDRVAVWKLKDTNIRLSALAADILVEQRKLHWRQLRLIRHCEWNDFEGPGEPMTGAATVLVSTVAGVAKGIGSVPFKLAQSSKRRQKHEEKKRRQLEQKQAKRSGNGRDTIASSKHGTAIKDKAIGVTTQNEGILVNCNNMTNGTISKTSTSARDGEIPDEKAPAKAGDKVTNNADMGKHTTVGSPLAATNSGMDDEDDGMDGGDSLLSADPEQNAAEEILDDVGDGLGKSGEALLRAPMDLSMAVAQGFHNAPRLYGDQTVRKPTRITGMKSGLKAAGEEFVFGIYDGVTGVVVQPYTGARDHGAVGFVKGVGMGLTGFVLKDLAAIIGPFGYTLKGIQKQLSRKNQPTHFIRKARIRQGQRDLAYASLEQRKKYEQTVSHGWSVIKQVWAIMDEKRAHGIRGRIQAMREHKKWRTNGAFENVDMAEKALAATKRGESLDAVFAEQRADLEKANLPRKPAMKDVAEEHAQDGKTRKQKGVDLGAEVDGTRGGIEAD